MCEKWKYNVLVTMMQREFGQRLGLFLANRFARAIKRTGDSCIDNFRVANIDCPEEMEQYQKAVDSGCCGFHDEIVQFKSHDVPTVRYKIGFNFGH